MSRFYAIATGDKPRSKSSTRCGHWALEVQAMSYQGVVQVQLERRGDIDYAIVTLRNHPDSGGQVRRVLFDGPCASR